MEAAKAADKICRLLRRLHHWFQAGKGRPGCVLCNPWGSV